MSELQKLVLQGLNLKNGEVTYNDCEIDPELSFDKQEWSFKEDLLQIRFSNSEGIYTIDVGWVPEFDKKGKFIVQVIKNYEWDEPVLRKKIKTFVGLKKCLQKAIDFVNSMR